MYFIPEFSLLVPPRGFEPRLINPELIVLPVTLWRIIRVVYLPTRVVRDSNSWSCMNNSLVFETSSLDHSDNYPYFTILLSNYIFHPVERFLLKKLSPFSLHIVNEKGDNIYTSYPKGIIIKNVWRLCFSHH